MTHQVEVRRSGRRTRTVSAWKENGRIVVAIPARFSASEERQWIDRMTARLAKAELRQRPSDPDLALKAQTLAEQYFGGQVRPISVRWSTRQVRTWGSCTSIDQTIRISTRLQGLPEWVLDYVLVHELAHLIHADHNAAFWALVNTYPLTERARGFLAGIDHVTAHGCDPTELD